MLSIDTSQGRAEYVKAKNLDELNALLPAQSFLGGWAKYERSLWTAPRTKYRPFSWSWADAQLGLDMAGRYISTEQADRRNLFMVNPIEGNHYASLNTLVTAYQMILPDERARSHRHSPNALRLVLEGDEGIYTVVDGVRLDMCPGDVVLTPGGCWHGHANEGNSPGYWIDYLDVPLVHLLEPMFFDEWHEGFQVPSSVDTNSPYVFPWKETVRRLAAATPDDAGRHGVRIELGSPALPTMSLHMQKLSRGTVTTPYRTTASQIFTVVSGSGATTIDDATFPWNRGDVLVVPTWHRMSHRADSDAVLFRVSDEPVHRALGFLRESGT